eukprot:COSAG01_NODE_5590_length_4160_cov_1.695395_3_plen_170_part_00
MGGFAGGIADCLRANKAMSAWGVEARVPFLDREVLDYNLSFDAADKMCVDEHGRSRAEKYIIRRAFDTPEDPYLPHDVLWRQKEQFSDGVGQCDRRAASLEPSGTPSLRNADTMYDYIAQATTGSTRCATTPRRGSATGSSSSALTASPSTRPRYRCPSCWASGTRAPL